MKCICEDSRVELKNTHCTDKNVDLILIGKREDKGIVISENKTVIATFDIVYCPICGKRLYDEEK